MIILNGFMSMTGFPYNGKLVKVDLIGVLVFHMAETFCTAGPIVAVPEKA